MPDRVNRLAFVDTSGHVCTVNPDGSDLRRLSEDGLFFQNPVWSPDGRRLAAIGMESTGAGVYCFTDEVRSFRGVPRPRELYYGQVQAPVYINWSPDSEKVSFLVGYPQSFALYLADAESGESRLLETGQPFFWDWLPDGAYLCIHTGGRGESGRVNFIDTDGDDWGENLSIPGSFQAPAISSDGRYWAFAAEGEDERSELVVEHHLTGERLSIPHHGAVAMAWQPGGHWLAFTSPPGPAQHFFGPLMVLDMETEDVTTLADETVFAHFWAPDGHALAYLTLSDPPASGTRVALRLWVMDLDSREPCLLTSFYPPVVFLDQYLPFFDQYARSHRLWSPDSSSLAVPAIIDNRVQIVVAPLSGERPQPIAEGFMPSWSPV